MSRVFTVVTYSLPKGTNREAAVQMFRESVSRYMAIDGLLRKNVLYREGLGGGAYLWESQEAADRAFSPEWLAYMTEKYGNPPSIDTYEMPITIDREHGIVFDEGTLDEAAE